MNTVMLQLTAKDVITKITISDDFDEQDHVVLEQYQNQMDRLRQAELIRRGMPPKKLELKR